jgi:hypothetical protein
MTAEVIVFAANAVFEGYALIKCLENRAGALGVIDSKNYVGGMWTQHRVLKIYRTKKGQSPIEIVRADTDHPCVLKVPQIEDREEVIKKLSEILKGFNHQILIVEDWP